jgi:Gene product 88
MGIFVKGNAKLSKKIWTFSLPPIKTCPNHGECSRTCYALKSWRMYPNVRTCWERNWETTKRSDFIQIATEELSKGSPKTVRIHVAGDFYDLLYFTKWVNIARRLPRIKFYSYTKNKICLGIAEEIKKEKAWPSNFNLISSFIDGHLNYGDRKYVDSLRTSHHAFLCPCTEKRKTKVVCGEGCNYCLTGSRPVFIQH